MTDPRYPFGYARPPGGGPMGMGTMLTRSELEAKQTVYKLNPEFWRRTIALMEYAYQKGVPLGVGDGWRVQPDPPPPGFAPPGNSNHEGFPADGHSGGAVAIDTVPDVSWDWMERNCGPFGIRTFRDVNSEPWHIQPSDIPASRNHRSEPWNLPVWPLPGDEPEEPDLEEDDEMPAPIVITASDGVNGESDAKFWWDGKEIGWIRSPPSLNVGRLTGIYRFDGDGNPYRNWTLIQIQREINTSWAGGPVPPGYQPPSSTYVDSAVG